MRGKIGLEQGLRQAWDENFGFLQSSQGAAIVLNMVGAGTKREDLTWQDEALGYVKQKQLAGVIYHRLNPVRCDSRQYLQDAPRAFPSALSSLPNTRERGREGTRRLLRAGMGRE